MRTLTLGLGITLAATSLTACTASQGDDRASEVPAGVASMYATVEDEIDEAGGETESGDWRIGYVVEAAEPWFEHPGGHPGGHQEYREPAAGETHHIENIPIEKSPGRIMPTVPIHVEVLDGEGDVVDEKDLNFYYAEFFHYANNFSVPEPGTYSIRATLGAPEFFRHGDEAEGPALPEGAKVTFEGVELEAE